MNINFPFPTEPNASTVLQKMQEQLERDVSIIRKFEEVQALGRYQFAPNAVDWVELLMPSQSHVAAFANGSVMPKSVLSFFDQSGVVVEAQRMANDLFPRIFSASSVAEYSAALMQKSMDAEEEMRQKIAGLGFVAKTVEEYERFFKSISSFPDQGQIEDFYQKSLGGVLKANFATDLEKLNPMLIALEEGRVALDSLWPALNNIGSREFELDEFDKNETMQLAKKITLAAEQESLREFIQSVVVAIQAQNKPSVQWMLGMFFVKVLELFFAGAVATLMTHYAPAILGESPQASKKSVKETMRSTGASPEVLGFLRYVSAKSVVVYQTPKALGREVGRLSFGQTVRIIDRNKDFALVIWVDKESNAHIQGWVFSRYLEKFD